jgi:hypothetical protein
MYKKATTTIVKIEATKLDTTCEGVWTHVRNPEFCTSAIKQYHHYTNPVAYEDKGYYYILTHFGSVQSLKDLNVDEITLDVIDLKKEEVLEFLLTFQYHQHKEIECLVELFKIGTAHTAKGSAGEKWLNSIISGTKDKEKQYAELFGLSIHATKCYLKLCKPEHKDTLAKFALNNEYTLTEAYRECCKRETNSKPIIGGPVVENQTQAHVYPTATNLTSDKEANSEDNSTITKPIQNAAAKIVAVPADGKSPASSISTPISPSIASSVSDLPQPQVLHPLTSEILVKFNSGQTLLLSGIVDFTIDGIPVISTNQLKSNGNDWELPDGCATFFLCIHKP